MFLSIYIYHGPPGSYKTSSAIQDFVIDWVLTGRPLVTNARGFGHNSVEEIWRIYGKGRERPQEQYYRFFDTVDPVSIFFLRYFFCWSPFGTAFLIDEAQIIYPKKTFAKEFAVEGATFETFISELKGNFDLEDPLIKEILDNDFYEGLEKYSFEEIVLKRPKTLARAFDMHRHYSWDFVFTMVSISAISERIRLSAESAQRHVNLATKVPFIFRKLFMLLGFFKEHSFKLYIHESRENGTPGQSYAEKVSAVDKRVFDLYASVAAGQAKDTISQSSVWDYPSLVFTGAFILVGIIYLVFFSSFSVMDDSRLFGIEESSQSSIVSTDTSTNSASKETAKITSQNSVETVENTVATIPTVSDSARTSSFGSFRQSVTQLEEELPVDKKFVINTGGLSPFDGKILIVYGYMRVGSVYRYVLELQDLTTYALEPLDYDTFSALGFRIVPFGRCFFDVRYSNKRVAFSTCYPLSDPNPSSKQFKLSSFPNMK